MKNKLALISAIGSIMFSTAALASLQDFEKPARCPYPSDIASAEVSNVESFGTNKWVVWKEDSFNTDNDWLFAAQGFSANDEKDALNKFQNASLTMQLREGPVDAASGIVWMCFYTSSLDGEIYALMGPKGMPSSEMYFHRSP